MIIEAQEDMCGDPCYRVDGHVDFAEFQRELAKMEDYGEDVETAAGYGYTHCYCIEEAMSERWPDGGWRVCSPEVEGRIQ